ncbi:hypothetical protein [Candidatus Phytoplasma bonamiae]|uniref:Chromosome segregation ATPase n=1 Tax=Candidatus Phytoplasma bonamiae TaxID=2982626 RepID=A0ABT9D493_9MOLU|nr:hypothetical protein ['Bonamia sp.' little leaf phytoplasma]MDO8064255.1 hypothetical protein ['Bonamia sp.' little leaf phytoplasma]
MNKSNFFQKNGVFIFFLIILGLVCCYFWFQNQKEKNLASSPESLSSEVTPASPREKRSLKEPPIPKIRTTAARLEKIKKYLFTENANLSLLPTDLSEREQEAINKLKKSWGFSLGYLNKEKSVINEYQNKCDEYQSQLNSLQLQIESLKPQQQKLEKQRNEKRQEVNRLKIDRKANKDKIDKIQAEISKIVGEIGKIKVQIGKLENEQEYYQELLSSAKNYKRILEERYEQVEKEYKNSIISQLNKLYEITPQLRDK